MFPRWVWEAARGVVDTGLGVELRGWSAVVEGRYSARPYISDVAGVCPVGRDVYVRRVLGVPVDGGRVRLGELVHDAFLTPFRVGDEVEAVARLSVMVDGLDDRDRMIVSSVFREGLRLFSAARVEGVPVSVEPRIPGWQVGLSRYVKPDLLVGVIPVDLTLAGRGWFWRKRIAIAGYVMAVEAFFRVPVDWGVVIGVKVDRQRGSASLDWRIVVVDDTLRREFLERRDMAARILEYKEDPGFPESCSKSCPLYTVCHGGDGR